MAPLEDEFISKIKTLNEKLWEGRVSRNQVDQWLGNFQPEVANYDVRRLHALHLASHFMYFGDRQIRELTRVIYRDLYKYPIVESIRRANGDTTDLVLINRAFKEILQRTLFLGLGDPSESGPHLLYYFRQENSLPKTRFADMCRVIRRDRTGKETLRFPNINRYVYIDDFCGSGCQATEYSRESLARIKSFDPTIHASYLVLFATSEGIKQVRDYAEFDTVNCVHELDSSFRCFGHDSRYFLSTGPSIVKATSEQMCRGYGAKLVPAFPLGFGDCQLLLGFHHNTPDNTLPVIWYDEDEGPAWTPLFRRYSKAYS